MRRYWITLVTGEYGYIWADKPPLFAEFVTITIEDLEGNIVGRVRGQVYKIEAQ